MAGDDWGESPEAYAARMEREWSDEFRAKKGDAYHETFRPKPNGKATDVSEPFDLIDASSWHGSQRPIREFLDERKLFPFGYASILSGSGAVGKTLIALQASVACTSGTKWLGGEIRQGPVLFYSAEEPIKEMHIRIDEICEAENLHLTALQGLYVIDLNAMGDAALIAGAANGTVAPTKLFYRLEKTIEAKRPVVVFLDNRGLLITGNENDRNIASLAMRSLQLLAEKYQCSIIMLAHPSLTGISTDTGASGSTAWANTARSVIYMKRPKKDEGGEDVDSDQRILTNNKANYAKHGTEVNLRWDFNRFICTDPPVRADTSIGKDDKAERVFMKLFRWHAERNIDMTPGSKSGSFPPSLFNNHPNREGVNLFGFRKAMAGLLDRGVIRLTERRVNGRVIKVLEEV